MIVPLCEYLCCSLLVSTDGFSQPEEKERNHDPGYDYGIRRVSAPRTCYDILLI